MLAGFVAYLCFIFFFCLFCFLYFIVCHCWRCSGAALALLWRRSGGALALLCRCSGVALPALLCGDFGSPQKNIKFLSLGVVWAWSGHCLGMVWAWSGYCLGISWALSGGWSGQCLGSSFETPLGIMLGAVLAATLGTKISDEFPASRSGK